MILLKWYEHMDIINYFLQNFVKFDNQKWYKNKELLNLIRNANLNINNEYFKIKNQDHALNLLKIILEPNTNNITEEKNILFLLLCFYFEIKSITINEIEDLLKYPIFDFNISYSLKNIIEKIRDNKLDGNPDYKNRRLFNSSLTIKTIHKNDILNEEKLFSYIQIKNLSTSDNKFTQHEKREQLETLVKTIENLLKKNNGKFLKVSEDSFFGLITNDSIKKYRLKLSCFRHGNENAIQEINSFSNEDINYFINLGIVICSRLYYLKENNKLI